MSYQFVLNLTAVSIGFVAAIFFCIGNAMNHAKQISLQATPFYGFNEHLASALASQRAQYIVGALLLVVSFGLQVWATIASPTIPSILPLPIHAWPVLVAGVVLVSGLIGLIGTQILYKTTMRAVLRQASKK